MLREFFIVLRKHNLNLRNGQLLYQAQREVWVRRVVSKYYLTDQPKNIGLG
jgi:hypothetical protein